MPGWWWFVRTRRPAPSPAERRTSGAPPKGPRCSRAGVATTLHVPPRQPERTLLGVDLPRRCRGTATWLGSALPPPSARGDAWPSSLLTRPTWRASSIATDSGSPGTTSRSSRPVVEGLLSSWDVVAELYAQSAPTPPERAWTRPEGDDNPYNAWYVTTDLSDGRAGAADRAHGGDQGQHHGGGRPDDERLGDRRRLRAHARRHRRHPPARGGRDDRRQGGLRGPVLLRWLAHLPHRTGAQPLGRDPLRRRVVLGKCGAGRRRSRRPRDRR